MKTYYISLTSTSLSAYTPQVVNGWFFFDTGSQTSNLTGASADGGTISLSSYTDTASGGSFFPWEYQSVDQTQNIVINNGTGLKGDTTIVFVPSGISTIAHDIIKMSYNPDNGNDIVVISRSILSESSNNTFNNFLVVDQFNSPIYKNVSFVYSASSQAVTYNPSITAIYSDMTRLFYNFSFTVYPNSIFDIGGVHLLNHNQTSLVSGGLLSFTTIEDQDSIVSNLVVPSL